MRARRPPPRPWRLLPQSPAFARFPRPGRRLSALLPFVALTAPLFVLIALGFAIARSRRWPAESTDALTRFVFSVAVPALLFKLMSDFSKLPPIDPRVLVAYFGACLAVFVAGRVVSRAAFGHDGVGQSVFALGGVFSNTVLLGLPLVQVTLGPPAMPAVSLIVVFNALTLWTLVSVSVEWARHGSLGLRQFALTARNVLLNPVVASILAGTAFGFSGLALPGFADRALGLLAQAAVPLSLVALGLGLGEVALGTGWRESVAIAALKLAALPLAAWGLARLVGLPDEPTIAVVVMAALPTGANVYLMARHFHALEGPVASSMVVSTALAALTTPLVLAVLGANAR
jgi:predicted permease